MGRLKKSLLATGVIMLTSMVTVLGISLPASADSYDEVISYAQAGKIYVSPSLTEFSNQNSIQSIIAGTNIAVMKVAYDSQSEAFSIRDAANAIANSGKAEHVAIVEVKPSGIQIVVVADKDALILSDLAGMGVEEQILSLVSEFQATPVAEEPIDNPVSGDNSDEGIDWFSGTVGTIVSLIAVPIVVVIVLIIVKSASARKRR